MGDDVGGGLRRSWCEVDRSALVYNFELLRRRTTGETRVAPVVKSNAYGHGLLLAARTFLDAGADWLCVDSLHEAAVVRDDGITSPLLVLGYVPPYDAHAAARYGVRVMVYDAEQVDALAEAAAAIGVITPLHIKLETGTHRQGLMPHDAISLIERIAAREGVVLEGVSSHFANVEDTTDHRFAREQLARFEAFIELLSTHGIPRPMRTIANSAATILWPEAHFELARPGLALYGMWPSSEALVTASMGERRFDLRPALTWKTRVAQVKDVPVGGGVGYGSTFRATHPVRIAVLPVGYYDGYDRGLSNLAHVLIRGSRAAVRGRVCMNMIMVDVTDIPQTVPGDEVVLLGEQGGQRVSAPMLAEWAHTINYEITTRIHEDIPRLPVGPSLPEERAQ